MRQQGMLDVHVVPLAHMHAPLSHQLPEAADETACLSRRPRSARNPVTSVGNSGACGRSGPSGGGGTRGVSL